MSILMFWGLEDSFLSDLELPLLSLLLTHIHATALFLFGSRGFWRQGLSHC